MTTTPHIPTSRRTLSGKKIPRAASPLLDWLRDPTYEGKDDSDKQHVLNRRAQRRLQQRATARRVRRGQRAAARSIIAARLDAPVLSRRARRDLELAVTMERHPAGRAA
jgi:hypothetical protein